MYFKRYTTSLRSRQTHFASCSHIRCPATPSVLGEGPLKNTLQHTHEIREATQSHSDEIMISNGTSTDREPVPAKAAGKSVGTLYHHPAVSGLMLFITLPVVTDSSKVESDSGNIS